MWYSTDFKYSKKLFNLGLAYNVCNYNFMNCWIEKEDGDNEHVTFSTDDFNRLLKDGVSIYPAYYLDTLSYFVNYFDLCSSVKIEFHDQKWHIGVSPNTIFSENNLVDCYALLIIDGIDNKTIDLEEMGVNR